MSASQHFWKLMNQKKRTVSPVAVEDWDKECEEAETLRKQEQKENSQDENESPTDENYSPTNSQSEEEFSVTTWSDSPLKAAICSHAKTNAAFFAAKKAAAMRGDRGQKRSWSLLDNSSDDNVVEEEPQGHVTQGHITQAAAVQVGLANTLDTKPCVDPFFEYRSTSMLTPCKLNSSLEQLQSYDPTDDTSEDEQTADMTLPLTHDYRNQMDIKSASKPKSYVPPHKRPDFTPIISPEEASLNRADDSFRFFSSDSDWTPSPMGFGRGRSITKAAPMIRRKLSLPGVEMVRNGSPGCWTLTSPSGPVIPSFPSGPIIPSFPSGPVIPSSAFRPVIPSHEDFAETSSRMRILQAQQSMMARSRVSETEGVPVTEMASWKRTYQSRYFGHTTPYIDTHCHIDFIFKSARFDGTYREYMAMQTDTVPKNYAGCVSVFCDPATFIANGTHWKRIVEEKNVWGTVGCHPKRVQNFTPQREEAMREMLKHPKMVALGEIGLDYSGNCGSYAFDQKQVFERQLEMAMELHLPVVIHCRDAETDCIEIMERVLPANYKIHRHCFTGSVEEARVWMNKFPNSYIGLTPLITQSSARAFHAINVAAQIDLRKLLLETDSPYFLPWVVPRGEMEASHPAMAITVAWKIAQLKGVPVEEVLRVCLENAKDMYGI